MLKLKEYFKSKEFIISFVIIFIFIIYNICDFMYYTTGKVDASFPELVNCFSFWRHTMYYNGGSIIMFLSPFIIALLSIGNIFYKFKGSCFKDLLLRQSYRKTIIKEFLCSYLKALFPFLFISVVVFILGLCLFPTDIPNISFYDVYISFDYEGVSNPFLYVFLVHIALILYVLVISNISLIVLRITKKMTVSIILSFALVNVINYVISNISSLLSSIIKNNVIVDHLYLFNIYEGYMVQSTVYNALINMGVLSIITTLIVLFIYRNKEQVVRDFE